MILKINKINNEKNEAALPQAIQFTLPIAGDLQTMNFPPLPLPEHCIKRQNSRCLTTSDWCCQMFGHRQGHKSDLPG